MRGGLVHIEEATFRKDGEEIRFQRARITTTGRRSLRDAFPAVAIGEDREPSPARGKATKGKPATRTGKPATRTGKPAMRTGGKKGPKR